MKKRLSTILATLLMTVTLIPFAPVHAKAASADVTRQMAGNRQIKDISKKMTAYTTAMNISVWSTTKPVKMKLNDNQKLSIAVFVRYNTKVTTAIQRRSFVPRLRSFLVRALLSARLRAARKIRIRQCSYVAPTVSSIKIHTCTVAETSEIRFQIIRLKRLCALVRIPTQ